MAVSVASCSEGSEARCQAPIAQLPDGAGGCSSGNSAGQANWLAKSRCVGVLHRSTMTPEGGGANRTTFVPMWSTEFGSCVYRSPVLAPGHPVGVAQ